MFDVQDAQDGRRYAAMRIYTEDEDGTVTADYNGVATVTQAPITEPEYLVSHKASRP